MWDFAVAHSFYRATGLNHTNPASGNNLNGVSHENATVFGGQLTWNIT